MCFSFIGFTNKVLAEGLFEWGYNNITDKYCQTNTRKKNHCAKWIRKWHNLCVFKPRLIFILSLIPDILLHVI